MGMFGGIGKNFWCLQVSFLKSKSIQAKNFVLVYLKSAPDDSIYHYYFAKMMKIFKHFKGI